jgi:hypothetical protein
VNYLLRVLFTEAAELLACRARELKISIDIPTVFIFHTNLPDTQHAQQCLLEIVSFEEVQFLSLTSKEQ